MTQEDLFMWSALANGLIAFGMVILAIVLIWHIHTHR